MFEADKWDFELSTLRHVRDLLLLLLVQIWDLNFELVELRVDQMWNDQFKDYFYKSE